MSMNSKKMFCLIETIMLYEIRIRVEFPLEASKHKFSFLNI